MKINYYLPAALWFVFILFATLTSISTLEVLNWKNIFSYDKPIHMILFGTQAYLLVYARRKSNQPVTHSILLLLCGLSAVYGIFIEILQVTITTTRMFDYYDMMANTMGCIVAYFWMERKRKTKPAAH